MSLFGNILEKLGLKKKEETPQPVTTPVKPKPVTPTIPYPKPGMAPDQGVKPEVKPVVKPMEMVDVVSKLEALAKKDPRKLDWKVSIVDLLSLLGIDSSYQARKELAIELGCPAEKMGDSAQMNMWLHKTVLQKIADNGGNIPKELLD